MNHFVLILYSLCFILDTVTILISRLLYKKFDHKVFKYLSILMTAAMHSMLVEAIRTYSSIATANMETLKRIMPSAGLYRIV